MTPSFARHAVVLWHLRATIGLNRDGRLASALGVLSWLSSLVPAAGLFAAAYQLMSWEPVVEAPVWTFFFLNLGCFVTSALYVAWPLMSAGVDDHSEVSRYAAYPISAWRLLSVSAIGALLEPRSLAIHAPVAGMVLGILSVQDVAAPWLVAPMFVLYLLFNAAWSRVALHSVLGVLQRNKSAETVGGGLAIFIGLSLLLPPVDASWLTNVPAQGLGAVSLEVVRRSVIALGRVPPGFLGDLVRHLVRDRPAPALLDLVLLAGFVALGARVALQQLRRLQLVASRAGPVPVSSRTWNPFANGTDVFGALVAREWLDLWRNPRARLLVAAPFILAVLMHLVSAPSLVRFLAGDATGAWICGGLGVYASVIMTSTFAQNAFAYDGQGLALVLSSPMPIGRLLVAKNVVHGASGVILGFVVAVFCNLYLVPLDTEAVLWALLAVLSAVPILLAAGNFLSVFFPVKFHANLRRRDRLPFIAAMLGVSSASAAVWPLVSTLLAGRSVAWLAPFVLVGWGVWGVTLPTAIRLVSRRAERILRAVTRE